MSAFTFDVFLSYNSRDKARVRRLAERLREQGLRVWFDQWVIKPGDDIYLAINRGLGQSRALVLCVSPAALGAGWVSMEHGTALFRDPTNRERRFVPLLLADCDIPETLKRYTYIDYRDESREAIEELLVACAEYENGRKAGRMVGERILIVEDNVALEGEPLAMRLRKAGYEVVGIAETEEDAVQIAHGERPIVVLMDIELVDAKGKKDRFAGLRAARQIRELTGAQVIFVTGTLAEPGVLSEAQKTAGCEFLTKPVNTKQLLTSIQSAVGRAKRKDLVFVCYSRGDRRFAEEMMEHVKALKGFGVQPWIDTQIVPSRRWQEELNGALGEAKAAICLVSSKFITSEFITTVELPQLLKAETERGLRVYPVFVNYVHEGILKPMGLLDFQGINRPDDPIATWREPKRHKECWGVLCKWLQSEMAGPRP